MANRLDGNVVFLKLLTSDATLVTLCSSRIYGPPLGVPVGMTSPGKALNFASDGELPHQDLPMTLERFRMDCYGETQRDAHEVYRAVNDRLSRLTNQRLTLSSGVVALIRRTDLAMGPIDLPDAGNNWPKVTCAWNIIYKETVV